MPFLFLALSVVYIFAPHVSVAFDYGPVGNNVFWVLLAAWSMLVAYILLQKRDALWRVIGSFAHALLTPGVRPSRRQRGRRHSGLPQNPHIYVPHEKEVTKSAHPAPPLVESQTYVMPSHVPMPRPQQAQTLQPPAPPRAVVHSTHMSTPAHAPHAAPHSRSSAAPAKPPASAPTPSTPTGAVQTKDTLTLEIIGGVPKMILKREKK